MRVTGTISEFSSKKGGFGKIKCTEQSEVRFERFECNYDNIRVNDIVRFDLVKSFDGVFDALNIEFVTNSELKELDISYQKQSPVLCQVLYSTSKGFVIAFKNITLLLPEAFCFDEEIIIGSTQEFYVHTFSYNNNIIATVKKVRSEGLLETFATHINSNQSFLFQIIEFREHGIQMSKEGYTGFVPDYHIVPFDKEKIQIGEEFFVKVIGCSMSTGLVLSIRNHYAYDSLNRLKNAFESEEILTGSITCISKEYLLIKCCDLIVKMNSHQVVSDKVQIGDEIPFKIVEFSMTKYISVSNIEVTKYGIINQFRNSNIFTTKIVSILENELIVAINDLYKTAFLPINELSTIGDKKKILSQLKIGSVIHCSITQFNCFGLYVSRLKYKIKRRQENASLILHVNDRIRVKIKKISKSGLFVENMWVKGFISISEILPEELIVNIDIYQFVNYTKNIFKCKTQLSSIIFKIDKENNKIFFDFDLTDWRIEKKINEMIAFFSYDTELGEKIKLYYKVKRQQQLSTLGDLKNAQPEKV